jgi:hypothetical protein
LVRVVTNDLVTRSRQALGPAARRDLRPAEPTDPASKLFAEARAAISSSPKQTLVATPLKKPGPEIVRLSMTCSARGGGGFDVIAERHGDELRFVGHEMPRPGQDGAHRLPAHLSGTYRIETKGWACPLCQNGNLWFCQCAEMNGAMHCLGTAGGRHHCACGRFEERHFATAEKFEVRGASVAATPGKVRPGSQQRGQPQLKQVSYERNR